MTPCDASWSLVCLRRDEVRSSFSQSATVEAVLTPDTKIGDYEVVAFIDAGLMGKVYRARDPRLRRDVAIEILPPFVRTIPTGCGALSRKRGLQPP